MALKEVVAEGECRAPGRHIDPDPWFSVSKKPDPPTHSRSAHFPGSQGHKVVVMGILEPH